MMVRKRRVVGALTVGALIVLGVVVASGGAAPAASYRIALVTGDNHDPFYVTMNDGAQAMAKKLGVKVTWQGPATFEARCGPSSAR